MNISLNNISNNSFKASPKVSKEVLAKMVKEGNSNASIAKILGIPKYAISTALKTYGLMSKRDIEVKTNTEDVLKLYSKGYSISEIRKETHLWYQTIKDILVKEHVIGKPELIKVKNPLLREIMYKMGLEPSDVKDVII